MTPGEDVDLDEVRAAVDNKVQEKKQKAQAQEQEDDEQELTDEELEKRAEEKRKIAQLLDRGAVNSRLDVEEMLGEDHDPSLHYEWIRETESDVDRMKALGFHIVTVEETEEERHEAGDNRVRVGDVILMACSQDRHELVQEAKEEKRKDKYGEPSQEYVRQAKAQGAPPIGETAEQVT